MERSALHVGVSLGTWIVLTSSDSDLRVRVHPKPVFPSRGGWTEAYIIQRMSRGKGGAEHNDSAFGMSRVEMTVVTPELNDTLGAGNLTGA